SLLTRPSLNYAGLLQTVTDVFESVKQEGDIALKRYTSQFDKVALNKLYLDEKELTTLAETVSDSLKQAITLAANNI
ncbi:histidinol dehydrogenase, partial [Acinetobacter baumannii]